MKKISVIVPMYNAENTIDECLSSLTAQTMFEDMELLLVDDHSTDNTVSRAIVYENRFPENVIIIKLEKNSGPGHARNVAMEYAHGEYIGYVDSDDAVLPSMYEKLYSEAVGTGADVVDCGLYDQSKERAIVYTSDDLTGILDDNKRSVLIASGGYIWSKVYRRDFLLKAGICFREEYVLEDMDYLMEVFGRMNKIANVKEVLYVYRDTGESLSKTSDIDRYLHSTTSAMEAIYNKLSVLPNYEGIREAVEYALIQLYSFSININLKATKDGIRNEEEMTSCLDALRELKTKIVRGGYDNQYVCNKMSADDINIMIENDRI